MRVVVCIEDAFNEGWFLAKNSAIIPEVGVPLCWAYDFGRPPLGKAVDFQREVDGEITAELKFFDEKDEESTKVLLDAKNIEASIYGNDIIEERHDKVREIHSFRIRSVNLVASNPAIPLRRE